MPIRLPKRWWEWVLVVFPTALILPVAAMCSVAGDDEISSATGAFVSALLALFFVLPMCFVAGFFLTQASARWHVSVACFFLISLGMGALNFGIAFVFSLLLVR